MKRQGGMKTLTASDAKRKRATVAESRSHLERFLAEDDLRDAGFSVAGETEAGFSGFRTNRMRGKAFEGWTERPKIRDRH